jgi:hypothetical protein
MISRAHGVASASQVLTGNLQYYTVWCESPDAFSDPDNATGLNIRYTGSIADETQKNFELLIQSIGLRTMPIILNNPLAVPDLTADGAASVTGEGFVWMFSVEMESAFATSTSDVGLLIEELDGIVLLNGAVISTSGPGQNIEFERRDTL